MRSKNLEHPHGATGGSYRASMTVVSIHSTLRFANVVKVVHGSRLMIEYRVMPLISEISSSLS